MPAITVRQFFGISEEHCVAQVRYTNPNIGSLKLTWKSLSNIKDTCQVSLPRNQITIDFSDDLVSSEDLGKKNENNVSEDD